MLQTNKMHKIKDTLGGKILRINLDGSKPKIIRFLIHMFIVTVIETQGELYGHLMDRCMSEHGNQANDEINEIKKVKITVGQ